MGDYVPKSDGAPSDESIAATYASNRVVGDVYPQGADEPFQRLLNTRGGGLISTNSDPSVVGVDPLTGANAPTGTDVGFSAPVRRFIQTGILNGDFSQGPPDASAPISADNPLPYWTYEAGGFGQGLLWVADSSYASGYKVSPANQVGGTGDAISQMVPIPMSQGQQYRVLLSVYGASGSTVNALIFQFYRADGTTTVGSLQSVSFVLAQAELKVDAGLVPATAAYLLVKIRFGTGVGATVVPIGEVRAAFPPAEATVGLYSRSSSTGAISTSETVVASASIPANTLVAGSQYVIRAMGTLTVTGGIARVATFNLRVGPTTLTGATVETINPTTTTNATADGYMLEAILTVVSVGATGTVHGTIAINGGSQPFAVASRVDVSAATTTIDTTVANLIELTAQTSNAAATTTFRQAYIQCVMAS